MLDQIAIRQESAKRRQAVLRSRVKPIDVIPQGTENSVNLVLLSRREGVRDWGVRSRLFDLNFKLSEGKLCPTDAERETQFRIARWLAHEPHTEFLMLWRLGRPMVRPKAQAIARAERSARFAALNLSDLDI